MLSTTENETESQAMIANDLRVLVSQLNEAVKKAAEKGLRIETTYISINGAKRKASTSTGGYVIATATYSCCE